MQKFIKNNEVWLTIFLMMLVFAAAFLCFDGQYKDTDNYMRALRIWDWILNPAWGEIKFMQSNYPFGEVLHWTRPVDLVWAGLAFPLIFFMSVKDAVFYAGMLFSPLFGVLTAVVLVRGLRPYMPFLLRLLVLALLFVQIQVFFSFAWGRPDHHAVLIFLSAWVLVYILDVVKKADVVALSKAALLSALMIWVAIEGLLFALFIIAALLSVWVVYGDKKYLVYAGRFAGVLAFGLLFAVLVNPPLEGYAYLDNGRISMLQVLIMALIAAALWTLQKIRQKDVLDRGLALVAAGVATLLVFYGACGKEVFISPINAELYEIWGKRVSELRPTLMAVDIFEYMFIPLAGVLALVLVFKRQPKDKAMWVLGVPLVGYTVLTFAFVRFTPYAAIFAVLVIGLYMQGTLQAAHFYGRKKAPVPDKVMAFIFVVFFGSILCTDFAKMAEMNKEQIMASPLFNTEKPARAFDIADTAVYLRGGEGAVLAEVFWGPEVMWKTGRAVVGTPYHRNVEGIVDTHKIWFAGSDKEAAELLQKHKVTEILFPLVGLDEYYKDAKNQDSGKFYSKLYTGKGLPAWLGVKVRTENFVIYTVKLP